MSALLNDDSVGTNKNRSIVLDCRAFIESDPQKAIALGKEAVSLIGKITEDNAQFAANLYGNLSSHYKMGNNLEKEKSSMEKAIQIIEKHNCTFTHDILAHFINFAVLLSKTGECSRAYSILTRLCRELRNRSMDNTMDYALIQMKLGSVCLILGDIFQAHMHYKTAVSIYEVVYEDDQLKMEAIYLEIKEQFEKSGLLPQGQMIS